MPQPVDLTQMSDDEIAELATRCLDCLSLADRVKAALAAFHDPDDREELASWIDTTPPEEDPDEEGE